MGNSNEMPGFLRLPTELRLEIFKYYYTPKNPQFIYQDAGSVLLTPLEVNPGPRIKGKEGNSIYFTRKFAVTPLLICRASYPEAFEALYTTNIFTFSEQLHSSRGRFSRKLTEPAKALIKHIRLGFQPQKPAQTNYWYQLVVNGGGRAGRASIRVASGSLAEDMSPSRVEFWLVYESISSSKYEENMIVRYAAKFRHIEGVEFNIRKAGVWSTRSGVEAIWDEVLDAARKRIEMGDWDEDDGQPTSGVKSYRLANRELPSPEFVVNMQDCMSELKQKKPTS